MNLLEKPTFGEVWLDNKLITPVDPYLHYDIIKASTTYKKMFEQHKDDKELNLSDEEISDLVIKLIKEKDLLNEKLKVKEGKSYNALLKKKYKENHIDINLARQNMGMCFQQFNLFNNYTILQNLILAPVELKLMSKEEATNKALSLLERIGLLDKKDQYPSSLSGGQKQRVAIARALVIKPTVILADEPTGALDHNTAIQIMDILKELNLREKITVIIVTHDKEVADICDRIIMLDDGKLV
jgi:ABC-type polar amino acid transport system ATPase subunit